MNFIILVNATDIQRKLTKTPDPCCSKWKKELSPVEALVVCFIKDWIRGRKNGMTNFLQQRQFFYGYSNLLQLPFADDFPT